MAVRSERKAENSNSSAKCFMKSLIKWAIRTFAYRLAFNKNADLRRFQINFVFKPGISKAYLGQTWKPCHLWLKPRKTEFHRLLFLYQSHTARPLSKDFKTDQGHKQFHCLIGQQINFGSLFRHHNAAGTWGEDLAVEFPSPSFP